MTYDRYVFVSVYVYVLCVCVCARWIQIHNDRIAWDKFVN